MIAADAFEGAELCDQCGRESCEGHGIPPDVEPPRRPALRFRSAADIIGDPAPDPIVEGIAWTDCVTVLVAESGAGKTFVLLDLTAAVSAGIAWYGRETTAGSVAYLSFEGDALNLRLRAARDVRGHRLDHLHILSARAPLSPVTTREGETCSAGERDLTGQLEALSAALAEAGAPPIRLVVVDTVRASLTGSEDSSEHVSAYLRAVRRCLAVVPGAALILAHHAGWQDGETQRKRERGSSAWRGNVDGTLYLEAGEYDRDRGECPLTLRSLKVRDGEKPPPLHLIRRRVDLAVFDRRGRPLDSCIIEPDRRSHEDIEAARRAEADAEAEAMDRRVLQALADRQDITSLDTIRLVVGARKAAVAESVARLVRRDFITPGRQRHPYALTDAGRSALTGGTVCE